MGRPGSGSRKAPGLEKTLGKAEVGKDSGGSRRIRIAAAGWEVGGRGGSRCADRGGGPGGPGRRGGGRQRDCV